MLLPKNGASGLAGDPADGLRGGLTLASCCACGSVYENDYAEWGEGIFLPFLLGLFLLRYPEWNPDSDSGHGM